jgi:hypothetical protein
MNLYCIIRRGSWTPAELAAGSTRSETEAEKRPDRLRHIRSYVLEEGGGRLGTICIYQATSEQAIREQSAAAGLPEPEIVPVSAVSVVRPDPEPGIA